MTVAVALALCGLLSPLKQLQLVRERCCLAFHRRMLLAPSLSEAAGCPCSMPFLAVITLDSGVERGCCMQHACAEPCHVKATHPGLPPHVILGGVHGVEACLGLSAVSPSCATTTSGAQGVGQYALKMCSTRCLNDVRQVQGNNKPDCAHQQRRLCEWYGTRSGSSRGFLASRCSFSSCTIAKFSQACHLDCLKCKQRA